VESAISAVEELEEALTFDHAQQLLDCDSATTERASSTQQLLDELLGRFEDDDSPIFTANGIGSELATDSNE
jgi:hypothetical protein